MGDRPLGGNGAFFELPYTGAPPFSGLPRPTRLRKLPVVIKLPWLPLTPRQLATTAPMPGEPELRHAAASRNAQ